MRILVTGGAGFIASHLTDALVELGHEVAIVDNMSSGKKEFINWKADFYKLDITDQTLERVFQEKKPQIIYHHAAQIDVQHSLRDPVHDANVNILGTIAILELSRKYGVQKIIYASSAAVYGPPDALPVDESHPVRPLSYYGISKHTPEHYIQAYANLYGLDYTILRYANAYGIRQDPKGEGGVISIFLDKLLNGQTAVIYGDGEQTRDFVYVKDIVAANIAAMTRGSRGLFNISRNEQTSVNELLSIMNEILGINAIPRYAPERPADIVHSRLNNEAAIRELLWKPEFSVRQGLLETCTYYAAQKTQQVSSL
ncbi:NAD-dependent epimerase/dehydratase family protein [Paenibacillus contaminans]|uniref:UDP-glucose 4-epimerase n=1 Tax=Paenibacillus contaminans TaxID=450362 RepID=A0A329M5E8_9BACL|nr:NAD-dependent epimerase/dehydratase family protein [Paenibacillus contaminans]RAV13823.1 UDP-glucose 4-epimerase [Paenibacillus contaminans]